MQVKVLNIQGQETGRTVDLPEDIFGIEPNDHAIYLAVKQYLGAQRQGTHKVKTRAEVQGASRKLHNKKALVAPVKEIFVTHCTKVVVLFSAPNHINTISS